MPARVEIHTVSITVAVGGAYQFALGGNPRRIAVTVYSSSGSQVFISNRNPGLNGPPIIAANNTDTGTLKLADFGPLIQGELWVTTNFVGNVIFITEIYTI